MAEERGAPRAEQVIFERREKRIEELKKRPRITPTGADHTKARLDRPVPRPKKLGGSIKNYF